MRIPSLHSCPRGRKRKLPQRSENASSLRGEKQPKQNALHYDVAGIFDLTNNPNSV